MLNAQSPIPLYHQLAELLIRQIRSGRFKPGDAIPSETGMAKTHGIGRPTVRQAVDVLVRKGLVERKRGSGTYVKVPDPDIDLFSLGGTSHAFHIKEIEIQTRIVQGIEIRVVINDSGNPFNNDQAFFLTRVTRDEKGPVLLEDLYLHTQLFHGLDEFDLENRSLSQIVSDHYSVEPSAGHQSFKVGFLTGPKADLIEIDSDTPLLEVARTLDFPNAAKAVFSRMYCLTDRFSFSQSIGPIHY